jgi:hypothetical protein
MKRIVFPLLMLVLVTCLCPGQVVPENYNVPVSQVSLSDPFIYADETDNNMLYVWFRWQRTVMCGPARILENWTEDSLVISSRLITGLGRKHQAGR